MAAIAFDLSHPEGVAHELAEANRRLAGVEDVPASAVSLIEDIAVAISDTDVAALEAVDPYLWIEIQRAAMHAQAAAHAGEAADRRRRMRIAIEQLRFLLTRLDERVSVGEGQPFDEVVRWLDSNLGSVPQAAKAALLGVSERTYQRWVAPAARTSPSADDERRVRIIARVVSQLRHSLTGPGVLDWFEHPREDLRGSSPRMVLEEDPARVREVLGAALASRSPSAA